MKRKYLAYTNQDIINKSKEVKSIAGLLRKLNLGVVGGNYYTLKRKLQQLNIDTTHWTGQGWSNGERLKDWTKYVRTSNYKKHLIKERGHICDGCKLQVWNGVSISLEVHHKDGNRTNSVLDNLQLLCPNCHALTDTWRGRKNK